MPVLKHVLGTPYMFKIDIVIQDALEGIFAITETTNFVGVFDLEEENNLVGVFDNG